MTDKKLTYKETIKALECCFMEQQCNYCPLYKEHSVDCLDKEHSVDCLDTVLKNAHALITRQQAETDRLNKEIQITKDAYTMLQTKIEIIKSEAVKEFADLSIKRICEQVSAPTPSESYIVERCNEEIDNLVKEMVGEEE